MIKKNNSCYKGKNLFKSKGFYIALSVCIAAVGITAFSLIGSPKDGKNSGPPVYQSDEQAEAKVKNERKPSKTTEPPTQAPTEQAAKPTTTEPPEEKDPFADNVPYKSSYILPLSTDILKDFSNGELVFSKTTNDWRTHDGIDFKGALGSDIKAINSGVVKAVYTDGLWGAIAEIDHGNGLVAKYCGLDKVNINVGDIVTKGAVIGTLGQIPAECSEPPHLHFETTVNGRLADPLAVMGKAGE